MLSVSLAQSATACNSLFLSATPRGYLLPLLSSLGVPILQQFPVQRDVSLNA